jgi:uncharacterized protein (DUF433 family)
MKLDRITVNPNLLGGQPCIRNLRLTVRRVLELLATYPDRAELYQEFPELEEEDIQSSTDLCVYLLRRSDYRTISFL